MIVKGRMIGVNVYPPPRGSEESGLYYLFFTDANNNQVTLHLPLSLLEKLRKDIDEWLSEM